MDIEAFKNLHSLKINQQLKEQNIRIIDEEEDKEQKEENEVEEYYGGKEKERD